MRKQLGKVATISDTRWACAIRAPHEGEGRVSIPRAERKYPLPPSGPSKAQARAEALPLVEAFLLRQVEMNARRVTRRKLVIR